MNAYAPSPYVPKLPIFSGSEEPQKGETHMRYGILR